MKLFVIFYIMIYISAAVFAQDSSKFILIKDIDSDNIADTIRLSPIDSVIVCSLSTRQYRRINSKKIYIDNENTMGIRLIASNRGFIYAFDWMRAGYSSEFVYDEQKKHIRLSKVSSYYLGNALGDGRHDTNLNLLTNEYNRSSFYFDNEKEVLVKEPDIREKYESPLIYLEDYDDDIVFELIGG